MKKIINLFLFLFAFNSMNAFMHTYITVVPSYGSSCKGKLYIGTCGMDANPYTLTVNGQNYLFGDPFFNNLCPSTYNLSFTCTDGVTTYAYSAQINMQGNNASVTYLTTPTTTPLTTVVNYKASSPQCTGEISLNITGGYAPTSYTWWQNGVPSTTLTTNPLLNLCPATYGFSVGDASPIACPSGNGFGGGGPITVDIDMFDCTLITTNVSCNGICDGTAQIIPIGPDVVMTNVVGTDNSTMHPFMVNNQCAGMVQGMAQHETGSMATCINSISEPPMLTLNLGVIQPSTTGGNGTANVVVTGGTPAYMYSWSGVIGSNTFSAPSGSYNLAVLDVNGCIATESFDFYDPLMITVGTIQHQTATPANGFMTPIISGGVPSYTTFLDLSGTLVASNFTNLAAGNYMAVAIDIQGNTASVEFTIGNALGINDYNSAQFSVYPNPANANIYVNKSGLSVKELKVMDINGRIIEIRTSDLASEIIEIDITSLDKGMYIIEVTTTEGGRSNSSFIKN